MSSIDKYVIEKAKNVNSRVSVRKEGGRLNGYLNGEKIFSLADRYGYLNESEEQIITSSIRQAERHESEEERRIREEERRRREEERRRFEAEQRRLEEERRQAELRRLEEVRKAKYRQTVKAASDAKKNVEQEMRRNLAIVQSIAGGGNFDRDFAALSGFNVASLRAEAEEGARKNAAHVEEVRQAYSVKLRQIESAASSVSATLTSEQYDKKLRELSGINTAVSVSSAMVDETAAVKQKLTAVKEKIGRLSEVKAQFERMGSNLAAVRALDLISKHEIKDVSDVNVLLDSLNDVIKQLKEQIERSNSERELEKLEGLGGALKICREVRDYVSQSTYARSDRRAEIAKKAGEVLDLFSALESAAYTTCAKARFDMLRESVEEIVSRDVSSETELELLAQLYDEGKGYEQKDEFLRRSYEKYNAMISELQEKGMDTSEFSTFDVNNYEQQLQMLTDKLYESDLESYRSLSVQTYIAASEIMKRQGYTLLENDLGTDEASGDSVAVSGVFVKKGMEGVAYQIIVDGENIRRRLVGLERTDGTRTSVEQVLAAAKKTEESHEAEEFLDTFVADTGAEIDEISVAVESDTEGSEQAVLENGYYELDEKSQAFYDSIVGKRTQAVYLPKAQVATVTTAKSARRQASQAAARALKTKRSGE